ncbi:MAG TPA: MotA/TolQ/ExbB proton channel family protein [Kofleriaceae bacterium]|jgi:biopolymer transport protein ExbB|nr:MotA/TolQ/ExbB proton channel family protein [Kofleriaceae bacterium]
MNDDNNTIDGEVLDLMLRAGSSWVLYLLLALSVAAIGLMIERLWFYLQERKPNGMLANALQTLRKTGTADALAKLEGGRSMEVAVARACLKHADAGSAAVEDYKTSAIEAERTRYERGLAFLGTLGNNAPFIGLFGTVLGIIRAFHDLAGSSAQQTQVVETGIAQALVATAIGLIVALPAVATYNAFTRHVERSTSSSEVIAHDILGYLKTPPGER